MSHDLCCHKCGSMHHSSQHHDAVVSEELSEAIKILANKIRIMAFQCESDDVMSCKFGNEFGDKVFGLLNESIKELRK